MGVDDVHLGSDDDGPWAGGGPCKVVISCSCVAIDKTKRKNEKHIYRLLLAMLLCVLSCLCMI